MQPTIIYEFPNRMSRRVKQKPDEPDWTELLRNVCRQMEIANGFERTNDPEDPAAAIRGAIKRARARRPKSPPDG